jgi:hypothetical protein
VLALSADKHSTENKEVKQVQPDSSTTPPIVPPLLQSKAQETVKKISYGQSCRRAMVIEGSHGYMYHQSTFLGEKMSTMLENPHKQIPKRWKTSKGKQAQIESQSLEPAASSFASERNWSTYSFIHSVKHNQLHLKRQRTSCMHISN